ncbi:CpaF family protein, partial [Thermococci archaeon]
VPSRVMNQLAEHTGLTTEELLEERLKREVVLQWMVEKGIRDIEEVGHYIREFYIDPESIFAKIEKDASIELTEKVRRVM